jgi:hypothetical protein
VVTAAVTALMVSIYGYNVGLWPTTQVLPAPLNRSVVFVVLTGVFLLLGWQAHVPLTGARVAGIGLGVVAAAMGIVLGRWLAPLPEEATLPLHQALLRKERKVALLLVGTLLLWPQEALLEPWPLALALLGALVAILFLRFMLDPVFGLFEIQRRPPDTSIIETTEVRGE